MASQKNIPSISSSKSKSKKIVVFDLDGTLNVTKCPIDAEMADLLLTLLEQKSVAIISGSEYKIFEQNILNVLGGTAGHYKKLFLFPTCGAAHYQHDGDEWREVYAEHLIAKEKKKIYEGFEKAFNEMDYEYAKEIFGEVVEDRDTQITFSHFGQLAPAGMKLAWDQTKKKRIAIKNALDKYLIEFEVRVSGSTSIDVTRKGIDKAYGIKKIEEHLGFKKEEMLFIGDMLMPGGNDYAIKKSGVMCVEVTDAEMTKKIIRNIIKTQ